MWFLFTGNHHQASSTKGEKYCKGGSLTPRPRAQHTRLTMKRPMDKLCVLGRLWKRIIIINRTGEGV